MPLTPGSKLGPYEILAPLGAGGMGEVYRARDTRLGRDVAVKVLPEHLSANVDVRARFEREARAVSSLNHPHICTLHDVGREGDTDYLVMELVEGETLARRLERGALSSADVFRFGAQIADALDRAHRAGIVHRDLKPANVMLTKSGAKLMDFGLARAAGGAGSGSGTSVTLAALSQSPTMSRPLTVEGTIVGTFQYMSPEQLEGKEADTRSDLWALGCVLYEMATGKRAFEGKSQASLIGAIMHAAPPPMSQIAATSPPALDRLVAACLAKEPADRVQSAHDVALQLSWMAEGAAPTSGAVDTPALPGGARRGRPQWMALALTAFAAAALSALVATRLPRGEIASHAGVQRYIVGAADLERSTAPMLSPDGTSVIFAARDGAATRIFRRRLSSFDAAPIEGTEEGTAPFFSPDGAWLGFVTPSAIKKVPIDGGVAQTIVAEPRVNSADWGADGTIYFTSRNGGSDGLTALARVAATGGPVTVVARLDTAAAESESWLPEILPDGKTVLISIPGADAAPWRIVAVRSDGSRQAVVENGVLARYIESGHLLYFDFDSQAVFAAPFDPKSVRVTGAAMPITEQVDANSCFDVAADGKLVYVPLPGAGMGDEIVWLDRSGAATLVTETRASWTQPRVSPDGRRILLRKTATNCELWMFDVERASLARIVQGSDCHDPIWSPDGRRIAYRKAETRGEMVTLTVEGAREVSTIAHDGGSASPQSWSSGGNLLVYTVAGRATRTDIWVKPMDGSAPAEAYLATEFNETDPSISPDGRWIAYASNEAGVSQVFIRAYPNTGTSWQVSIDGGGSPLWSRDGRELFFTFGTKMMAAPIETRPAVRVGAPVELFGGGFNAAMARVFDAAPDGRFVAVRHPGGGDAGRELRLIINWQQELARSGIAAH